MHEGLLAKSLTNNLQNTTINLTNSNSEYKIIWISFTQKPLQYDT